MDKLEILTRQCVTLQKAFDAVALQVQGECGFSIDPQAFQEALAAVAEDEEEISSQELGELLAACEMFSTGPARLGLPPQPRILIFPHIFAKKSAAR